MPGADQQQSDGQATSASLATGSGRPGASSMSKTFGRSGPYVADAVPRQDDFRPRLGWDASPEDGSPAGKTGASASGSLSRQTALLHEFRSGGR
jgi:hypothetical protein